MLIRHKPYECRGIYSASNCKNEVKYYIGRINRYYSFTDDCGPSLHLVCESCYQKAKNDLTTKVAFCLTLPEYEQELISKGWVKY